MVDDVKAMVTDLVKPEIREHIVGLAEVKEVFRASKVGEVAGCMVIEGTARRNLPIRVLRDSVVIYEVNWSPCVASRKMCRRLRSAVNAASASKTTRTYKLATRLRFERHTGEGGVNGLPSWGAVGAS